MRCTGGCVIKGDPRRRKAMKRHHRQGRLATRLLLGGVGAQPQAPDRGSRYAPPRRCWPPVAAAHALKVSRRLCRCHPPPAGDVAVWRWRRAALLAARPVCAAHGGSVSVASAGAAVPLAAAAGPGSQAPGRQAAPLRMALEQLPALASRGPLGAGKGQWQALRRQGPGACSCLVQVGWGAGGVRCRKVATLHQAPSGSGAQSREKRAALSSVALSPRGVARWRASAKTRSPYVAEES